MRPAGGAGGGQESESSAVPQEYHHKFNYLRAILAWGTIAILIVWNSMALERSVDKGQTEISVGPGLTQLLMPIGCLAVIVGATVAIVRRLADPCLPKTFLVNQFHIAMFPSPLLVSLSMSAVSMLFTVIVNIVVGVMYFRKVQREKLEQGQDVNNDLIQIVLQYILKGVPNVSKYVAGITKLFLSAPLAELAKWILVRRYHAANTLPLNVLARRTVSHDGMLALAIVSAVGWALPGAAKLILKALAARQGAEKTFILAGAFLLSVWHVLVHAVSTSYMAVAACRRGDALSVWHLARAFLIACFVHSFPSLAVGASGQTGAFALPGFARGAVATKLSLHALPIFFVAVLSVVQYRRLPHPQQTQGRLGKND